MAKSTEIVNEEAEARREWEKMKKDMALLKKHNKIEEEDEEEEEEEEVEEEEDEGKPKGKKKVEIKVSGGNQNGIGKFFVELGILAKPRAKGKK
jgi:hypothetical protein